MDKSRTWTVVKFDVDNTVEAVPTPWLISGNECLWPPFTGEKLSTAIKNHLDLNTCWPTFKVNIFRNATYGKIIINLILLFKPLILFKIVI